MVVRSVESMTPEPKLMTISSSRNIRRRWLPNRPPRVDWALVLATVLAISTAFIYAARGVMYASAVRWANGLEMDSGIEFLAEKGLLALVALTAGVALWTFFCSRRQFWTLVSAGVGVVTAYALSECIKVLVAEPRPCTASTVSTVIACPAAGDWSWPSNHAVLAAAFATACIITQTRTVWVAAPLAAVVAASRVLAGVHYVHDVLSGLALGAAIVATAVIALGPLLNRKAAAETTEVATKGSLG